MFINPDLQLPLYSAFEQVVLPGYTALYKCFHYYYYYYSNRLLECIAHDTNRLRHVSTFYWDQSVFRHTSLVSCPAASHQNVSKEIQEVNRMIYSVYQMAME